MVYLQNAATIDKVVVNMEGFQLNTNVPSVPSPPTSSGSTHSGTMADDDLEYHITFPAPTTPMNGSQRSLTTEQDDNEGFVYIPSERKEPVVVLLGWYACQDRHLSKYSKIYEGIGCITIRFIPRPDLILYQPENMRSIASKLLEVVTDFNLEEHPIIIHMFSNGGCYMYRHICELMSKTSGKTLQIRGCIFDSGPAVNTPLNVFRAIATTTRGNLIYRWIRGLVLMFVIIFAAVMEFLLSFVWSERRRIASHAMWTCLSKDPQRCPQLFLYSRADKICNYKSIKSFAEERRKCGVPVVEVCWEDSPHVKHFMIHRLEYIDRVVNFMDMCLGTAEIVELGEIVTSSTVFIEDQKGQ